MFITYGLQYLDKIALGYAAVLGLSEDIVSTLHYLNLKTRTNSARYSILLVSSTLGQAAYFISATSSPLSLAPTDLSNFPLANTWLELWSAGRSFWHATERYQILPV
jgi:hypothetical protein